MQSSFEILFSEQLKVLNSQRFIEEDLDYGILQKIIPYLEKIEEYSNSGITIFDLYKKKHIYISGNIERIFNLSLENASKDDSYFEKRIHPDDVLGLTEAGIYFLKYGLSLPGDEKKNGKLVSEYRILTEKNEYIRIIEQQICIEVDIHGNAWLAMGIMDISPKQDHDLPVESRLIRSDTGEIFRFPKVGEYEKLSNREIEILKLISKGLVSKQIADELYISVHTVNTHRQRILEKLQAENSLEAIFIANKYGILSAE